MTISSGNRNFFQTVLRLAILLMPICFSNIAATQTFGPGPMTYPLPIQPMHFANLNQVNKARLSNQKWFWSPYAEVAVGTAFYRTGNAYYLATPMGLQLNKQLNKNLYAFGNAFIAPSFTSYGSSFMPPTHLSYMQTGYNPNYFSVNPGVQMGLMYVNDEGTFSISGSVQASRVTYPAPPPPPTLRKK